MRRNTAQLATCVLIALLFPAAGALGQQAGLPLGSRVRIASVGGGIDTGRLVGATPDSVVIEMQRRDGTQGLLTIQTASIKTFERSVDGGGQTVTGVFLGVLGGGVAGALIGRATYKKPEHRTCPATELFCLQLDFGPGIDELAGGVVGALVGALVGGVIGASLKKESWVPQAFGHPPTGSGVTSLIVSGRRLGMSIAF